MRYLNPCWRIRRSYPINHAGIPTTRRHAVGIANQLTGQAAEPNFVAALKVADGM